MKKLMTLVLVMVLVFSNAAYALELDDIFGGLTSMFAPKSDKAYGLLELVETDTINIELTNVMESTSSNMYELKAGNEYLIIEFEIENKDVQDLSLSTMLSFSTWCDGELCTISIEALGTAMLAGKAQLDCVVEPGSSVKGVIGYEVPKDWAEVIVQFKGDSIFGKTVDFVVTR